MPRFWAAPIGDLSHTRGIRMNAGLIITGRSAIGGGAENRTPWLKSDSSNEETVAELIDKMDPGVKRAAREPQ